MTRRFFTSVIMSALLCATINGAAWGDEGYGYVKYGVLEGYQAIHAITGQTFVIPEPSTLMLTIPLLPAILFWCARRSR